MPPQIGKKWVAKVKEFVDNLNAIPSKRLFFSIIVDYDLERSISELVDNAIDIWNKQGKKKQITIEIDPDIIQQTLQIADNAGGIRKEELSYVVGPGQTTNEPTDEVIGYFGVGNKRAVVALAQDIKITTRHKKRKHIKLNLTTVGSLMKNGNYQFMKSMKSMKGLQ